MSQILFYEKQRLHYRWVWIFATVYFVFVLFLIYGASSKGEENWELFAMMIVPFVISILFYWLSYLETVITANGIYYGFYHFSIKLFKLKFIPWSEIKRARIDEFWMDEGSYFSKLKMDKPKIIRNCEWGPIYLIKGDDILLVNRVKGKDIHIGTQKPKELEQALKTLITAGRAEQFLQGILILENKKEK